MNFGIKPEPEPGHEQRRQGDFGHQLQGHRERIQGFSKEIENAMIRERGIPMRLIPEILRNSPAP
jgi:hypothetical protein